MSGEQVLPPAAKPQAKIARAQGNIGGLQGRVTVLTKDGVVIGRLLGTPPSKDLGPLLWVAGSGPAWDE